MNGVCLCLVQLEMNLNFVVQLVWKWCKMQTVMNLTSNVPTCSDAPSRVYVARTVSCRSFWLRC